MCKNNVFFLHFTIMHYFLWHINSIQIKFTEVYGCNVTKCETFEVRILLKGAVALKVIRRSEAGSSVHS